MTIAGVWMSIPYLGIPVGVIHGIFYEQIMHCAGKNEQERIECNRKAETYAVAIFVSLMMLLVVAVYMKVKK